MPNLPPLLVHPLTGLAPDVSTGASSPFAAAGTNPRAFVSEITNQVSFEGMGQGLSGYSDGWAPPDANGAVGPNHYVQIVNSTIAVFSKSGSVLLAPVQTNILFSGFGGTCEQSAAIDPSVLYDQMAKRWLVGYPAGVGSSIAAMCVAVSTSDDPTGTYARYAFAADSFDDYPKFAVWPDAYYATANDYNPAAIVWAFDRTKMLAGMAATAQVAKPGAWSLLPANLDGSQVPPTNSPAFFVNVLNSNTLGLWRYHVDWSNPLNSTLTFGGELAVSPFQPLCSGYPGFYDCIPQLGTSQLLEALSDRLMYRLAYRNFGTYESLVVNHSVAGSLSNSATPGGIRWYEIRSPATTPVIYQQGTYLPDANYRWMGSVAMDRLGDIAVGYSESSASMYPAIAYTGRQVRDPLGTLAAREVILINGSGSQQNLDRWGDYSAMAIDPSDDCTFWYTTEHLANSGAFNWRTRIGAFKFRAC